MATLIRGTDSRDFLLGTIGEDVILGLKGDDDIRPDIGHDIVNGGKGNDLIFGGGATNDPDNDILLGDQGQDQIFGQNGDDLIDGGVDNDFLGGDGGNDRVLGGPGHDTVDGGFGNDVVDGGPGNDRVLGVWGNDTLHGGSGDDVLDGVIDFSGTSTGKGEIDTLIGNGGNDVFVLGGGSTNDASGRRYQTKAVYYDDGTVMGTPLGKDDYAIIRDFKVGHDVIQLYGTKPIQGFPPGDYLTCSVGGNVEIYRNYTSPGFDRFDELIAVVKGVKSLDLYSNSFAYVA